MSVIRDLNQDLEFLHPGRYVLESAVGRGSYAEVFKARDLRTNEAVAIKRIREEITDRGFTLRRVLRELIVHSSLSHHPNIVRLVDVLRPPEDFTTLYMVLEWVDCDLGRVMKVQHGLTDDHVRWIICQLLRALNYLHECGIIHRDVSPGNILVNAKTEVKLCDLGLARDKSTVEMTEYVATRWYRAPELVIGCKHYTEAVDVWSAGCILGQMFNGNRALFQGTNARIQLHAIISVIGTPSDEDIEAIESVKAREHIRNSLSGRRPWPLDLRDPQGIHPIGADAKDLLNKMLQFNPLKRITINEALQHEYLRSTNALIEEEEPHVPPRFITLEDMPSEDDIPGIKRALLQCVDSIISRQNQPTEPVQRPPVAAPIDISSRQTTQNGISPTLNTSSANALQNGALFEDDDEVEDDEDWET